jgi:hypothetical protein
MKRLVIAFVTVVIAGCAYGPGGSGSGGTVGSPGGGPTDESSGANSSPGTSGSEAAPGSAESSAAVGAEPTPFAETPSAKCNFDKEPSETPTFFRMGETTLGDGVPVAIQHGLYANEDNELFRIDVAGPSADAVEAYTANLRVCLDFAFSEAGGPAEGRGEPEAGDETLPKFGESADDLLIDVAIEAVVDQQGDPKSLIEELRDTDPAEWRDRLMEFSPAAKQDGRDDVPYVIDGVFDPRVTGQATHQYVEKWANKVWAKVSSIEGTVKAGLCRGTTSNKPFELTNVHNVTVNVPVSGYLDDSQSSSYWYDLAVRGNPSGRYRVANKYGYAGWYRDYWLDPLPGSTHTCSIPLT